MPADPLTTARKVLAHPAHYTHYEVVCALRAAVEEGDRMRDVIAAGDIVINDLRVMVEKVGLTLSPGPTTRVERWIDDTRAPILEAMEAADRAAGRET